MTKTRKLKVGDVVTFSNWSWYIIEKTESHFRLARREAMTSPPIRVEQSAVKLADESWRDALRQNDTLKLFIAGYWCMARVTRREGMFVYVQPSFTNYVKKKHIHSGCLAYAEHNYPLWAEDDTREVLYNGMYRIQRSPGLMYPWTYGESQPVKPLRPKSIVKLLFEFDAITTGYYPFSIYDKLETEEIVYDLARNVSRFIDDQEPLVFDLVYQYISLRQNKYKLYRENTLQEFVDLALENNDQRRVSELLSATEHESLYAHNEWLVQQDIAQPYFDMKFSIHEKRLQVEIIYNLRRVPEKLDECVSRILSCISEEQTYSPGIVEVDSVPEESFILSRMLAMESEPLELLSLRKAWSDFDCWLTEYAGFCKPTFQCFGGVLACANLSFENIVNGLMQRSPKKTLIIVSKQGISRWKAMKNVSSWYGRRRSMDKNIVVTTPGVFIRTWIDLVGFQRVICFALPSSSSYYGHVLNAYSCKTRWAVVNLSLKNASYDDAYRVHPCVVDSRAVIRLDRNGMRKLGVTIPEVDESRKYFAPYKYEHVLENVKYEKDSKRMDIVSKYLLNTSLISPHLTGTKIDNVEATVDNICDLFKLDKARLQSHLQDKCAICLEHSSQPMVTRCGHVFCASCTQELKARKSNCPLCRKQVDGYVKVSNTNTAGHFVMHKGSCYSVKNTCEKWGEKITFVKKYQHNATFLTKHTDVKRKLKKKFPKAQILTAFEVEDGARVKHGKVIAMEPLNDNFPDVLVSPWGKNIEFITLCYKINV